MSSKEQYLLVEGICSHCGEPVGTTAKDLAYRHGFKRHKMKMSGGKKQFSQEDGKRCPGSGKLVTYRRVPDEY